MFNVQESHDKALSEFKQLVEEHNRVEQQIVELTSRKNELFLAAKQREYLVITLAETLNKKEDNEVSEESSKSESKEASNQKMESKEIIGIVESIGQDLIGIDLEGFDQWIQIPIEATDELKNIYVGNRLSISIHVIDKNPTDPEDEEEIGGFVKNPPKFRLTD